MYTRYLYVVFGEDCPLLLYPGRIILLAKGGRLWRSYGQRRGNISVIRYCCVFSCTEQRQ